MALLFSSVAAGLVWLVCWAANPLSLFVPTGRVFINDGMCVQVCVCICVCVCIYSLDFVALLRRLQLVWFMHVVLKLDYSGTGERAAYDARRKAAMASAIRAAGP